MNESAPDNADHRSQPFTKMSGITYYIDTLMFKADTACLPLKPPLELVVVGE
jgi:hypothetical protein